MVKKKKNKTQMNKWEPKEVSIKSHEGHPGRPAGVGHGAGPTMNSNASSCICRCIVRRTVNSLLKLSIQFANIMWQHPD